MNEIKHWEKVVPALRSDIVERLELHTQAVTHPKLLNAFLKVYRNLRIPAWIRNDIDYWAKMYDMRWQDILLLNMDYEIGGCACTCAAVPDTSGYRMVRALDWDVPASLSSEIRWRIAAAGPSVEHREVPGYVGVLTGRELTYNYAVALNQSPNPYEYINPLGIPISWHIASGLRAADCVEGFVEYMLASRPICGGFITVIGRKHAWWLECTAAGGEIIQEVKWPKQMTVCNDYEDGVAENRALKKWNRGGRKGLAPFPVRNADTVDLVSFRV